MIEKEGRKRNCKATNSKHNDKNKKVKLNLMHSCIKLYIIIIIYNNNSRQTVFSNKWQSVPWYRKYDTKQRNN